VQTHICLQRFLGRSRRCQAPPPALPTSPLTPAARGCGRGAPNEARQAILLLRAFPIDASSSGKFPECAQRQATLTTFKFCDANKFYDPKNRSRPHMVGSMHDVTVQRRKPRRRLPGRLLRSVLYRPPRRSARSASSMAILVRVLSMH
jgi:hypothetical protein